MPERVQLRRTKGWRMPPNTVKVDRAGQWGNPFRIGHPVDNEYSSRIWGMRFPTNPIAKDAADAVELFRATIAAENAREIRRLLRGKNLACWCAPGQPCHADALLEIANATPQQAGQ